MQTDTILDKLEYADRLEYTKRYGKLQAKLSVAIQLGDEKEAKQIRRKKTELYKKFLSRVKHLKGEK